MEEIKVWNFDMEFLYGKYGNLFRFVYEKYGFIG